MYDSVALTLPFNSNLLCDGDPSRFCWNVGTSANVSISVTNLDLASAAMLIGCVAVCGLYVSSSAILKREFFYLLCMDSKISTGLDQQHWRTDLKSIIIIVGGCMH